MQAQLAALADAEAALRRAQPNMPRSAFTLFTENMRMCVSLLACLDDGRRLAAAPEMMTARDWQLGI